MLVVRAPNVPGPETQLRLQPDERRTRNRGSRCRPHAGPCARWTQGGPTAARTVQQRARRRAARPPAASPHGSRPGGHDTKPGPKPGFPCDGLADLSHRHWSRPYSRRLFSRGREKRGTTEAVPLHGGTRYFPGVAPSASPTRHRRPPCPRSRPHAHESRACTPHACPDVHRRRRARDGYGPSSS